jgi:hypothetical protein
MAARDWEREIRVAAGSGDRVGAARMLPDAARSNVLSTETLQDLINDIWVMQDRPAGPPGYGALTDDEWVEVFTAAGQFVMPRKLPFEVTDPMRIFRAAPQERARGMSWCNSWRMADGFRQPHRSHPGWETWGTDLPWSSVLAVLYRPSDGVLGAPLGSTREVVVDPKRLPAHLEVC